tara:strand:- start:1025 stop:2008 length:984 start_codon:yes stop_codon:yes gene_type:complete
MVKFDTVKYSDILHAKKVISSNVIETPLIYDFMLSKKYKANIYFKLENIQRTGSFKIRGALNNILNSKSKISKNGVLAWSSGNHAQGVAEAASIFSIKSTIIMPKDAPQVKILGTRSRGSKIIFYDRNNQNREEIGYEIAKKEQLKIIPPYDHKLTIAGQGTVGLEIVKQMKAFKLIPDNILVPTGGGGLISGSAIAIKENFKDCNIFSVEPKKFDDYARSLKLNKIVKNKSNNKSICDSLLSNKPGMITFNINKFLIKKGVSVNEKQVLEAIRYAYNNLGIVVEPGGAVGLAAILNKKIDLKNSTTVAVLSGSNIDPKIFKKSLTH